MAFDFPASPSIGQTYQGYTWDGEKWGGTVSSGAVRYDIAQGLTALQRAQGRANIDALKKNYIMNGGMMISQENGAAAGTTSGYYPVDQFYVSFSNAGAISAAQVASQTPGGSTYRLRITVTTPDATVGAGDFLNIAQPIEGTRVADLLFGTASAKQVVIPYGIKAPAGTYCVSARNGLLNRAYVGEVTISAGEANTDTIKYITFTADTSGTWAKDNTVGIYLTWALMCGSTYQTTAGAWTAGNVFATSNQFNFMSTNGNVFELFDVGLYEGAAVPNFQLPDFQLELLACQRHFNSLSPGASGVDLIAGSIVSGVNGYYPILFPVPMRIIPTMSLSAASHWSNNPYSAGSTTQIGSSVVFATSLVGSRINLISPTTGAANGVVSMLGSQSASAAIRANARM
jgi:hypothetical protein